MTTETPPDRISPLPSKITESVFEIKTDPKYQELLVSYQNGQWDHCRKLIHEMLLVYPGQQHLLEFRSDIETQVLVNKIGTREANQRKRSSFRGVFLALLGGLIIVIVAGFLVNNTMSGYQQTIDDYRVQAEQAQEKSLVSLVEQARLTIQAGKPAEALTILDQIEAISPNYPGISDLRATAAAKQNLAVTYEQAIIKVNAGLLDDALALFNDIMETDPKFRDTNYQIEKILKTQLIAKQISEAQQSYQQKEWESALIAYEKVLTLDTTRISDPKVKEELLYSYLRTIIQTLSQKEPSIDDLDRCGGYYRKALSLIPQDKKFIAERDNLRALSVELLITKYFQTAKMLLKDPNQAERSVIQAVDFLNRALELDRENSEVKTELEKALQYQDALTYFNQSNWEPAIKALEKIAKFDSTYPNGMVPVLLYEAYAGKGFKYFSGGFYLDARAAFEKAEILAWEDQDNKLRLFEIQIALGLSLGKLENYKDAVSYIDYALSPVLSSTPLAEDVKFLAALKQARDLNAESKYFEAYQIYLELLKRQNELFIFNQIAVNTGDNLAFIANTNYSTVHSVQDFNEVTFPVVDRKQSLSIPSLPSMK
jgi:tetratricopeptide (TPR) repeat protein